MISVKRKILKAYIHIQREFNESWWNFEWLTTRMGKLLRFNVKAQ